MKTERLRKMLLKAFQSSEPGERMVFMDAVLRIVKAEGKDEYWLVEQIFKEAPPFVLAPMSRTWERVPEENWPVMLDYCKQQQVLQRMNSREVEFIASLSTQVESKRYWGPTIKQERWLTVIYKKMRGTAPRDGTEV